MCSESFSLKNCTPSILMSKINRYFRIYSCAKNEMFFPIIQKIADRYKTYIRQICEKKRKKNRIEAAARVCFCGSREKSIPPLRKSQNCRENFGIMYLGHLRRNQNRVIEIRYTCHEFLAFPTLLTARNHTLKFRITTE